MPPNGDTSTVHTSAPFKGEGQYIFVCLGCGDPKKKHEKSLRVRDKAAVDFDERDFLDITMIFCPDCKERMKKWLEEGIRGGVKRMQERQARVAVQDQIVKTARGYTEQENANANI